MTTRVRDKAPARRRQKLFGAKLGGAEVTWYESRTLAATALRKEVEHWIRFAERYERASLPRLQELHGAVVSAYGPTEWEFEVSGMRARLALVERKSET